jgi:preprotein translocase subunit SecD
MKSIVYILIAIFIGTTLFSAIPKRAVERKQKITLQCIDKHPSLEDLDKSARIIESRLKDFGLLTLDVSADEYGAKIEISFDDAIDMASISPLLTSKGKVEFYEIADHDELIKSLSQDEELRSIFTLKGDEKKFDDNSGVLGYCKQENKALVDTKLINHRVSKTAEAIHLYWSAQPDDSGYYSLFALKNNSALDNSYVSGAVTKTNFAAKSPALLLSFNEKGSSIWWELSKRNIGRSIAIVLDQTVLSAPTVREGISGGKCMITGDFKVNELDQIRTLILHEELPLDFKLKN